MVAKAIERIKPKTGRKKIKKPRKRRTKREILKAKKSKRTPHMSDTDETKRLLETCKGRKKKSIELFAMSDYITVGRIEAVLKNIKTAPYGLIVHEYFIKTFGCIEMVVIVSYLLYMEYNLADKTLPTSEQWFVVLYDQLKKYTGLKHNRVCNTIKELRQIGLIETKRKGMPARQHFRIDNEFLMSLLFEANPPRGWKDKNIDELFNIHEPESDSPLFKNQKHLNKK